MAVDGQPRNYDKAFLFSVEIDGIDVAWFESCSELSREFGVVEAHEGGTIGTADESPGKLKTPAVTLSVGATDNDQLYEWSEQVGDAVGEAGEIDDGYKKSVDIVQRDRDKSEKKRYRLTKAWPSKFVAGAWDAKQEQNVVQQVTLTYHRWSKV
jgi:phage tail-like protein